MKRSEWDEMVEKDKKVYDEVVRDLVGQSGLSEEDVKGYFSRIFDIGYKEGQAMVWFTRSGLGVHDDAPEPSYTITTTQSDKKATYVVQEDGSLMRADDDFRYM